MNLRRGSRYWLLVPLILIAILARDWVERPAAFEGEETIDMRATEADYYLEGFTTRRFDRDGALEYRISGEALSHFPDDGRSEVSAPRLELRRPGVLWRARADSGRLDIDPDVFTLLGDVRLERTATAGGQGVPTDDETSLGQASGRTPGQAPERTPASVRALASGSMTIFAKDLSIALDDNEVSTDSAFEVVAGGWRLAGVGLRSSIEEGKLVLLSDVNGTFDAASPD